MGRQCCLFDRNRCYEGILSPSTTQAGNTENVGSTAQEDRNGLRWIKLRTHFCFFSGGAAEAAAAFF